MLIFVMDIPERIAKRNFVATISSVDKDFYPGGEIIIPYFLENKSSRVMTEISVTVSAPGLDVLSGYESLYKSIGGKSTKSGELKPIYVPKETVPGVYSVELNWYFHIGSKMYTKTNRIKLKVVS